LTNAKITFWVVERKGIGGLIIASSIQPMRLSGKENELLIIPQEHIDLLLQFVYKDPKVTGGRDRIYQYIKENFVGVSRRRIMEFLRNQESYQLRFREKKPRITTPIFSSEVNGHWQADLIDFQKYNERGFKWILTVVDVFSKYLWARPLKNKSAEEVKEAFSRIFKERRPIVLQTDNGKEFKNTVLANYLHLWGITQVFSKAYTPTTQGMVERYNQTLKHKIFNGFLRNKNKKWVDDLPSYVENINTAKQSVTKEAPLDIQKSITPELQAKVEQRLTERNERKTEKAPVFRVGDTVRINLPRGKNKFDKRLIKWSKEIYPVQKVIEVKASEPWSNKRYIVNNHMYSGFQLQYVNMDKLVRM
jgi:transposase InsO family protein